MSKAKQAFVWEFAIPSAELTPQKAMAYHSYPQANEVLRK